jgi:hypothetical protein
MGRILSLSIKLDQKGHGKQVFTANGALEAIIIKRNISFPTIRIYSQEHPEFVVFEPISQMAAKTYFPRAQCHSAQGKDLEHYDKIYMAGPFVVEISSGTPESTFVLNLVMSNG